MDYSGEKFLDKLYNDLYMSDEVQHTKENKDKRYEAIRKYLERLERVHSKANTESKRELLKSLYYNKYVIKEDVLRKKIIKINGNISEEIIQGEIDKVISAQRKSLSKWIDYLSNDTANYPTWAKYWVFQGMLKMGNYDEGIEGYQKRSKDTEGAFVDANPEIIAKAIETIQKSISNEKINDEELQKIINLGNFSKIYTLLEKRYKNNVIEYSGLDGIWIKYNQGSKEDAIKLCESLQNKNTHWCTASEGMAISQVCGPYNDSSNGGDFYVYYTKDKEGNYSLPRIAIRMINHDKIGEIRGIEDGQNMEEEMTPILESKLNEMSFLDDESKNDAFKKIDGLRELTGIYKKTIKKEEISEEELNHLYSRKYGFGWTQDPKVDKILKKRNKIEDFNKVNNQAKLTIYNQIDYNKRQDLLLKEDFILYYFNKTKSADIMKYVNNENISNYDEYVKSAITSCFTIENVFQYIDPKLVKNYDELAKLSISNESYNIKFIDPKLVTNFYELFKIAANEDENAINWIKETIEKENNLDYDKLAKIAVLGNEFAISNIDPKLVTNYDELAKIAISKNGNAIRYIHEEAVKNYNDLANQAVKNTPFAIVDILPQSVSNYQELATIAVKEEPFTIGNIEKNAISNYEELANIAFRQDKTIINRLDPNYISNYDELALRAVKDQPQNITRINPECVSNYEKLFKQVNKYPSVVKDFFIKNYWIVDNFNTRSEARIFFIKTALKTNGLYLEDIDPQIDYEIEQVYQELSTIAVNQNPKAIKYVNKEFVTNYEELEKLSKLKKNLWLKAVKQGLLSKKDDDTPKPRHM